METMKKRRKNTVVNISNIILWHQYKLPPSKQYYFSFPSSNLLTYLVCCLLTSFVLSSQIDQRNIEHFYPRNSHIWASLVSIPKTQPVTQSSTDTGPCPWDLPLCSQPHFSLSPLLTRMNPTQRWYLYVSFPSFLIHKCVF